MNRHLLIFILLALILIVQLEVEANLHIVDPSSGTYQRIISILGGSSSNNSHTRNLPTELISSMSNENPKIIFSDVDGTLVHYPDTAESPSEDGNRLLLLPPSSTGMKGVISSKTLQLCQNIRRQSNAKFIIISGMRTQTFIKRLPFLPKADAYATEAGGRIFYPVTNLSDYTGNIIQPEPFDGATDEDLTPFGLVEDMEWRSLMSRDEAAGLDGYIGDSMDIFLNKTEEIYCTPLEQRKGNLWNIAKELQSQGFVIDHKGYASCFRVNLNQQNQASKEDFESLSTLDVSVNGLGSSINLGCIDFYPMESGKRNCCAYLALQYSKNSKDDKGDELLQNCICLCDDDNDLEMAMACGKAFLPSISSETMKRAAQDYPNKIIICASTSTSASQPVKETKATEVALMAAIEEMSVKK